MSALHETTKQSKVTSSATAVAYRDRVYRHYVSAFKGRPEREELRKVTQQKGKIYDYLFRPILQHHTINTLVEVACGQGQLMHWAQRQGIPNVSGCDLSAEQIEVALELGLDARCVSYQTFLQGFKQDCDLIVGQDIIEHLTKNEAFEFLDLCFAALKPGGHLLLTTPNGAAYRPGPVQFGDLTHATIFSPLSMSVALKLANFDSVEVRELPPPWTTSIKSCVRATLWRVIRCWPMICDLIETGAMSTRVLTRVMVVHAQRPAQPLSIADA